MNFSAAAAAAVTAAVSSVGWQRGDQVGRESVFDAAEGTNDAPRLLPAVTSHSLAQHMTDSYASSQDQLGI